MDVTVENDRWLPAQADGDGRPKADNNPEVVIDDYIAGTYQLYLKGEDQFPEQVQVLEDFFGEFYIFYSCLSVLTPTCRPTKRISKCAG